MKENESLSHHAMLAYRVYGLQTAIGCCDLSPITIHINLYPEDKMAVYQITQEQHELLANMPELGVYSREWYHEQYLKSSYWKHERERVINEANGKCVLCGSDKNLNVHHTSYDKLCLGDEPLICLCSNCHKRIHYFLDCEHELYANIIDYLDSQLSDQLLSINKLSTLIRDIRYLRKLIPAVALNYFAKKQLKHSSVICSWLSYFDNHIESKLLNIGYAMKLYLREDSNRLSLNKKIRNGVTIYEMIPNSIPGEKEVINTLFEDFIEKINSKE